MTFVFPALSETFILDQVIYLIEQGHDVRILAERPREEAVAHAEVARYGLVGRTLYLGVAPGRRARLGVIARAAARAPRRFASTLLAFRRARRACGETGTLSALASLVEALAEGPRPDVIVCHFGMNGALAARALDVLGWTVPLLTIFHGFDVSMMVQRQGAAMYAHLFRRGRLFLPVSDVFAERLRRMGAPDDRVCVQRMCVDPRRLDDIARSAPDAAEDGGFTFIAIGRLVAKKGTASAVRAFARALGGGEPGMRLVIVGDGPLRGELESIVRETGVGDRVVLLGAQPRTVVLRALRAANVFVQASVTAPDGDMEGMPVAVFEAMAFALPVIATRHSGIPELVEHNATGLLVEEHDEPALAEAMLWMAANREQAVRMGQAGRARLDAGFTAQAWNALFEQRLREVTGCAT